MNVHNILSLPDGLPARFADPETGCGPLCQLLNVTTRAQQQGLVNHDFVKGFLRPRKLSLRNLSTAKRLRVQITTFYGLTEARRNLWEQIYDKADPTEHLPSFEYQALKNYDPNFLDVDFDELDFRESFSDFPDISEGASDLPQWKRPALTAWTNIRSELLGWDVLLPARRDEVAFAAFAVATILDDVRLLQWAVGQVNELANEYAFAFSENHGDSEEILEQRDKPDGPLYGTTNEFIENWNAACQSIADKASTLLGDLPRIEDLDGLVEEIQVLRIFREPLLEFLQARQPEKFLERVGIAISDIAGHEGMSWLGDFKDKILAQWQEYYLASGNLNTEQLRQDVERGGGQYRAGRPKLAGGRTHNSGPQESNGRIGSRSTKLCQPPGLGRSQSGALGGTI